MGYRLHVATKCEVVWSGDLGLNHKDQEFKTLLNAMGVEYNNNMPMVGDIEINRTSLDIALDDKLRKFSQLNEEEQKIITLSLNDADISLQKAIRIFENILKQADPNNDMIHCFFF